MFLLPNHENENSHIILIASKFKKTFFNHNLNFQTEYFTNMNRTQKEH